MCDLVENPKDRFSHDAAHKLSVVFQAVSFKANNSQLRVQLKDMKDDKDESGTENENYIETLEKDMAEMKETHQATIVKLRQEHQKEVGQSIDV